MEVKRKELERSYRDIINIMKDIMNAKNARMYKTLIIRFNNKIEQSESLRMLLKPYYDVNTDNIIKNYSMNRWYIEFPAEIDVQIAFILQILKKFSNIEPEGIETYLFMIYNQSNNLYANVQKFNTEYVRIAFREIAIKIKDLIEDIPSDKMEVEGKYMTIINYGNYNSSNSQVANGNQNTQTQNINTEDFFKNIIDIINKDVNENEKEDLIKLVNELKETKTNPERFKEKVTEFIKKTARYSKSFMDIWGQLDNMFN